MKIAGETAKRDLTYKISVDEELSTVEDKHYSLPETTVFSKGVYHDTCYVRLNKTADLSNRAVRLVLRLEGLRIWRLVSWTMRWLLFKFPIR